MMEAYSDLVWSDERAPQKEGLSPLGLGALAAAGLVGGYTAVQRINNPIIAGANKPFQPLDLLSTAAKLGGNLSPFSVFNTFRFSEFLSPFVQRRMDDLVAGYDPATQQMMRDKGAHAIWTRDQLKSHESFSLIKQQTGLSDSELAARGIVPGMVGQDEKIAQSMLFIPDQPDSIRGSLHTIVGDQQLKVADDFMLMQASPHVGHISTEATINKAAQAQLQAGGLTELDWWDNERVLRGEKGELPKFLPVNAPRFPKSLGDINNATAYLRSFHAFGLERMNVLAEDVGRQIPFVGSLNSSMNRLLGFDITVKQASALSMYGRLGGKAAAIGALGLGVAQLDWARRQGELPGHAIVSGIFAGGAAFAAHRLGATNGMAGLIGLGALAAQAALPGFSEGIGPGVVSTLASANVARASFSPFNVQRRILEGYFPGISNPETGALLGLGVLAATKLPFAFKGTGFQGRTIAQEMLGRFGNSFFGLDDTVMHNGQNIPIAPMDDHRQAFYRLLETHNMNALSTEMDEIAKGSGPLFQKRAKLFQLIQTSRNISRPDFASELNKMWVQADELTKTQAKENPLNLALLKRLQNLQSQYAGTGIVGDIQRTMMTQFEMFRHAAFGADLAEETFMKAAKHLGATPRLGTIGTLFAGTMLVHGLLTGSLLGSEKTAQQLQDEYSGKRMVEVRKGRFWEMGSSQYAGDQMSYYRPSLVSLYLNRVEQKSIWGTEEDKISPIGKWIRENFTYELEKKNYYTRPYPISVPAFSSVPVIGGILSSSIGSFIKPRRLMHTDEYIRQGERGMEYAEFYEGDSREPSYEMGALDKGVPITPGSMRYQYARNMEQLRELEGFFGFAQARLKHMITGSEHDYTNDPVLADSGQMTSLSRQFWQLQMGGGFGCFVGNTLVLTKEGSKPISQVKIGEEVFNNSGWYEVTDKLEKEVEEELLTISSKVGGVKLTCTSNHHIPVIRRNRYSNGHARPWPDFQELELEAKDIQKDDYLLIPILQEEESYTLDFSLAYKVFTDQWVYSQSSQAWAEALELLEQKPTLSRADLRDLGFTDALAKEVLYSFRVKDITKRYKRYLDVDEAVAYALGWYVAEGCANGGAIVYTMNRKELHFAEFIASTWETKLGCNTRIAIEGNTLKLFIYSSVLAKFLPKLFGDIAKRKFIPFSFQKLPREILKAFIDGLQEGDGWKNEDKWGFTSASSQLVKDYSTCLLKLGIPHSLCLNYKEIPKEGALLPQGTLRKPIIRSYINGLHEDSMWRFWNGFWLVRIAEITKTEKQKVFVYDLTVKENHYYTADRVLVHNSNEIVRRFLMKDPSEVKRSNPLRNTASPSWLPARYSIGDQFAQMEWGSARMPGAGFEALHPELKGVDPEDYPDIYKYQVLCIDANTYLPTMSGYKQIKDISINDYVIGADGNSHKVQKILFKEATEDQYHIYSFYNEYPLIVSGNHILLTSNKNKEIIEKQAKDITVSDYVLMPKSKFGTKENICIGDYVDVSDVSLSYQRGEYFAHIKGSHHSVRFNLKANYHLGFVFGLYLSEGCANSSSITWCFHRDEAATLAVFIKEFAELLGIEWKERFMPDTKAYQISINNRLVRNFFVALGSKKAAEKEIKFNYLDFTKDFCQGIFDGIFNGDGYIAETAKTTHARLSLISFKLLSQIRHMGFSLGIVSGIRERKGTYKDENRDIHTAWVLDVQRKDISKINMLKVHKHGKNRFNLSDSIKLNFEFDNYLALRIKQVEIHKQINCSWYDLHLGDTQKSNLFVTHLGLVHNSDLSPFSDEYQRIRKKLYQRRLEGKTTESENSYMDYLDTLTARKTDPIAFAAVSENAYQLPGSSVTQGITGMTKSMIRKAVAPAEYIMLPPYSLRPFHKLMGDRDPIEMYEYTRLYGCLLEDTLIATNEGYKFIKDIRVSDLVYSEDGTLREVLDVIEKDYKKLNLDIYSFRPKGINYKSVFLTEDHKLLVRRLKSKTTGQWKETHEWVAIKDLKDDRYSDLLVTPVPDYLLTDKISRYDLSMVLSSDRIHLVDENFLKLRTRKAQPLANSSKPVKRFVVLDDRLMKLLGYYMAEGDFGKNKIGEVCRIYFTFHREEIEFHQEVLSLMKEIFGIEGILRDKKTSFATVIEFNSIIVAQFLSQFFSGISRKHNKMFLLKQATRSQWQNFLCGWLHGDGHYEKRRVSLVTSGEQAALLALRIGELLGALGSIDQRPLKDKTKEGAYSIRWSGDEANVIYSFVDTSFIGESVNYQSNSRLGFIENGFVYRRISRIEKTELKPDHVYDLTVKDVHSFCGIGVTFHNSSATFWDKPWRDFLRPAMYSAAHSLGYDGKPAWRAEADNVSGYFDKLQFLKYQNLADQAQAMGDIRSAKKYEYMASGTKFGVNPQGSAMSIYWTLPAEERPYFNAFAYASGQDRERIRQMIPGDQVHLYEAIWKRIDNEDPTLMADNPGVNPQYMAAQMSRLQESGFTETMPNPDWVGWREGADLNDVKIQYVEHLGRDLHDFGLWEKQARGLAFQPYLEGSYEAVAQDPNLQAQLVSSDIYKMGSSRLRKAFTWANPMSGFNQDDVRLIMHDDRSFELNQMMRERYE